MAAHRARLSSRLLALPLAALALAVALRPLGWLLPSGSLAKEPRVALHATTAQDSQGRGRSALPRPAAGEGDAPVAAAQGVDALKEQLRSLAALSERGGLKDGGRDEEILSTFEALERQNPTKAPLESDLLQGEWELIWTSSESILGLNRPWPFRPKAEKPILQYLDPKRNYARNLEYTPTGQNSVEATIKPLTAEERQAFTSKLDSFLMFKYNADEEKGGTYIPDEGGIEQTTVGVKFEYFKVFGWLKIKAPEKATGILQITYLDDDLRLSRGDRGNLFVLRRVGSEETM